MNYELIKNKVWKTLNLKKSPGKTQMGIEVGWMVDCKIKHRALLWLSLVITRHFFSPVGLVGVWYMRAKEFSAYAKGIMKGNNKLNSFACEPLKSKQRISRHDNETKYYEK